MLLKRCRVATRVEEVMVAELPEPAKLSWPGSRCVFDGIVAAGCKHLNARKVEGQIIEVGANHSSRRLVDGRSIITA